MVTYRVGDNYHGETGYVHCDDEWAQRPMPWYPYIVYGDLWTHLPATPSKSFATALVRDYLERDEQ